MKRRGFLGLLFSAPVIPFALKEAIKNYEYVEIDGTVMKGTKPLEIKSGSTPAYSFTNDTDTGFYRTGAELVSTTIRNNAGKIADSITKNNTLLESLRNRDL